MSKTRLAFDGAIRKAYLASAHELSQVRMLERLGTVESICAYPDITAECSGIGIPCGISFKTTGAGALVIPNGVTDPNDGFRLVKLPLKSWELAPFTSQLVAGMNELRAPWRRVSADMLDAVFVEGIHALHEFGMDVSEDVGVTYDGGREPHADPRVLSPAVRGLLMREFGAYGTFSHFIELVCIDEEPNGELDLEVGDVLLLIHGGSMRGGERFYLDSVVAFADAAIHLEGIEHELYLEGVFGLPSTHHLAKDFLRGAAAMSNMAYAWRSIIQHRIERLVRGLGLRADPFELLSDIPHNRIRQCDDGIHYAKSAQPTHTPDGEPMNVPYVMCGYPGTQLYLFVPDAGAGRDAHVSHGGATLDVPEADLSAFEPHIYLDLPTNREGELPAREMLERHSRLAAAGYHEHVRAKLVRHVARLRPLANFRGDPKDDAFANEKF